MSRFEQVVDVARAQMEEWSVPGVAIGILSDGEEEIAALGVTSIENPLEVTADTLFQIGSITKTFVASAIMRLVEAGEVGLDEPVRAYLRTSGSRTKTPRRARQSASSSPTPGAGWATTSRSTGGATTRSRAWSTRSPNSRS